MDFCTRGVRGLGDGGGMDVVVITGEAGTLDDATSLDCTSMPECGVLLFIFIFKASVIICMNVCCCVMNCCCCVTICCMIFSYLLVCCINNVSNLDTVDFNCWISCLYCLS